MGSNQFQKEYIEYLQERNTELIGKLNYMKQHYENKILSRDLNKRYLMSTLQDVSHICTEIPREIDLFFDQMTAAMNMLKNVLLRKAEMMQLVEKITKVINSTEKYNTDFIVGEGPGLLREPDPEINNCKKAGMVKVSPMINGHIISTEPRIYLNRVTEMFTPETRYDAHQLSPIIEASPDISDMPNVGTQHFKEAAAPSERMNINKLSFNYMNEESPKSRFKGPKTWKKSLSSTKSQSENQRNLAFSENKENINKKIPVGEIENADPLEGPSWLHNENETHSSPRNFMDYKRRKHRFAAVFDKVILRCGKTPNEECVSCFEGKRSEQSERDEGGEEDQDDVDNENEAHHDKHHEVDEEFYDNHKTKDDKEDFKEFGKGSNESSVDLFCEPSSIDLEESVSPSVEELSPLKRRHSRQDDAGSFEKDSAEESEENCNSETSPEAEIRGAKNTSISGQSNHSGEGDCEAADKSKKSRRKRISKTPLEGPKSGVSSESDCGKLKTENPLSGNNDSGGEQKSPRMRDVFQKKVFVKLEDCLTNKKTVSQKLESKSPNKKKTNGSSLTGECESPKLLVENEGRKRRKAAPTFKLVEPKLITKLRRN